MRRWISFVVAWVIAAGVATFVASQGVSIVGDQVTTERPAALSTAALEEAIDGASSSSTSRPDADGAGDTGLPTSAATSPAVSKPPTTTGGAESTRSATTEVSTTSPTSSSTTPTTEPDDDDDDDSTTTSTTATSTSNSSTPAPAASETRTYNLVGGTAALRFSSSGVTVEYATPKPGFQVEIEPEHTNGVKVEFRSDSHRSRVSGWWEGGPVDSVREEAD